MQSLLRIHCSCWLNSMNPAVMVHWGENQTALWWLVRRSEMHFIQVFMTMCYSTPK